MPRRFNRPPNSGARLSWAALQNELRDAATENNDNDHRNTNDEQPAQNRAKGQAR